MGVAEHFCGAKGNKAWMGVAEHFCGAKGNKAWMGVAEHFCGAKGNKAWMDVAEHFSTTPGWQLQGCSMAVQHVLRASSVHLQENVGKIDIVSGAGNVEIAVTPQTRVRVAVQGASQVICTDADQQLTIKKQMKPGRQRNTSKNPIKEDAWEKLKHHVLYPLHREKKNKKKVHGNQEGRSACSGGDAYYFFMRLAYGT
eukprot:1161436-Pelagomonas_calceolata.AAC.2